MIFQFCNTAREYPGVNRIYQRELVRMHGYAQIIFPYDIANLQKLFLEEFLPSASIDRVRCERHEVRGDPEEIQFLPDVVFDDLKKALQIPADGFNEPGLGVVSDAERSG